MKVNLVRLRPKVLQGVEEVCFIHLATLKITVNPFWENKVFDFEFPPHEADQQGKKQGLDDFLEQGPSVKAKSQRQLILGHPHPPDAKLFSEFNRRIENNGVDVHMEVRIDVREGKASRLKFFKLSCQFFSELSASLL